MLLTPDNANVTYTGLYGFQRSHERVRTGKVKVIPAITYGFNSFSGNFVLIY